MSRRRTWPTFFRSLHPIKPQAPEPAGRTPEPADDEPPKQTKDDDRD